MYYFINYIRSPDDPSNRKTTLRSRDVPRKEIRGLGDFVSYIDSVHIFMHFTLSQQERFHLGGVRFEPGKPTPKYANVAASFNTLTMSVH